MISHAVAVMTVRIFFRSHFAPQMVIDLFIARQSPIKLSIPYQIVDSIHTCLSSTDALHAILFSAGDPITFDDIAGLDLAKAAMFEAVVLPKVNPAMFNSGLTRSSRGVLLFGPPGERA